MQEIKINITKAQIHSYTVTLKEGKPNVSVTVLLWTDNVKAVTSLTISSDDWREEFKFQVPDEMVLPIDAMTDGLAKIISQVLSTKEKS